jgi:hypothetical protein
MDDDTQLARAYPMTALRIAVLIFLASLLSPIAPTFVAASRGDDRVDGLGGTTAVPSADDEGLAIPPGDPWCSPEQEQERQRPGSGGGSGARLVFKDRISPHWFDKNTRFWDRNDLAGGAREFVLVDAGRGVTRSLTFTGDPLEFRL